MRSADIAASPSFESMKRYLEGNGASHGLLVVLANGDSTHLPRIQSAFERLRNVSVVSFDLASSEKGKTNAQARRGRTR